jgi:hypothetical protein
MPVYPKMPFVTDHYKRQLKLVLAMTTTCILFDAETESFVLFSWTSDFKLPVSGRHVMAKARVRSRASESEICGEN